MFSSSIGDNIVACIMCLLFLSSITVFWISLALTRNKISPKAIAVFWEKSDTLRLICFLSFVMTNSYQAAFLDRPMSRVVQTGILGVFWGFLVFGLFGNSVSDALLHHDMVRVMNYGIWTVVVILGIFQSLKFSRKVYKYEN